MSKPTLEGYSKLARQQHKDSEGYEYELIPVRASYVHNGRRFVVVMMITPELESDSLVSLDDLLAMEAERFLISEGVLV